MAASSPLTEESTSKTVRTAGWNLHYHDAGSGPAVLLLHGSGPGATAWSNFHLNITALARTNRVLALDQPGWGASDPLEAGSGGHVQAVLEFLDALAIDRVALIGNSMGGINAIEFAVRYPERVSALITMGAPDLSQPNIFSPAGFSLGLQEVYRGYRERTHEVYKHLVDVMTFDERFLDDALIQQRLDNALAREYHLDAFLARAAKGPDPDRMAWSAAKLAGIAVPTLLIHGRDDQVVSFESSLRLLTVIPNSRVHVFNQCGHWAQLEKADDFNDLVANFLAREVGPADIVDEHAAIHEVSVRWRESFISKDASQVVDCYAPDAVLSAPGHPVVLGRDAVAEFFANTIPTHESSGIVLTDEPLGISKVSGDLAWEWQTYAMHDPAGNLVDSGKLVTLFERVDGEWKIAGDTWNSDGTAPGRANG